MQKSVLVGAGPQSSEKMAILESALAAGPSEPALKRMMKAEGYPER